MKLCSVLLLAGFLQISLCASIKDDMKMDEVIMAAAKTHKMFDLVQDMGGGEMMYMVEMDLLMSFKDLIRHGRGSSTHRNKRKATSMEDLLWKDCYVYYDFTDGDFSPDDIAVINQAIADWENYTCLQFVKSSTEPDRIVFRDGGGCYSRLGKVGGEQPIALATGCRSKGIVVHEIGHAIGWIHEQARPDRDDFVTVNFNQIPPNWRSQFAKLDPEQINDRDVTYDYDSVMHYSGNTFGERTIATKDPRDQDRLGQRIGLSFRDIKLANTMYGCAAMNRCPTRQCPGEGFQGKNCKCLCPGPLGNPVVECSDQGSRIRTTRPPPTTTTTTTPAPPTTTEGIVSPPEPECMDVRGREECERLRQAGQCATEAPSMSVYCRKTCNLCGPASGCMDYTRACPFFAANGYCERAGVSNYFKEQCPLSCKICSPTDGCQAALSFNTSPINRGPVVMVIVSFLSLFVF